MKKNLVVVFRIFYWPYSIMTLVIGFLAYHFIGEWISIYVLGFFLWILADIVLGSYFDILIIYPIFNFFIWVILAAIFFLFYSLGQEWLTVVMFGACSLFGLSVSRYPMHLVFLKFF